MKLETMPEPDIIRLSELTTKINQSIKTSFGDKIYWVIADVTSHSYKPNVDRHYFILAEKQNTTNTIIAKIEAVAWGPGSSRIREFEKITGQRFQNDINVLIKVSVDYNPVYGIKVTLHDINSNYTIGVLEQDKKAILARLLTTCADFISISGEKYITFNNQLKLSPVIQQIALIASAQSAGYEDFMHTLQNNNHQYKFIIDYYFTTVQGEGNAVFIKQKLIDIYQSKKKYDAIVIIRGGGAQTDFLIFETYILGQIVAKFPIPIITGIGHQRNETIVDLMAHTSTNAPTKAAEFIIEHNRTFEEKLLNAQNGILIKSQQLFSTYFQLLASLNSVVVNQSRTLINFHKDAINKANHETINISRTNLFTKHTILNELIHQILLKPGIIILNRQNDLKNFISNFSNYNRIFFQTQNGFITHYISIIKIISPVNILKKGFALVYQNGKISRNADSIAVGKDITILLAETEITASVKSKINSNGTEFKL